MTAIIAYENLMEHADSVVSAVQQADGYPVENIYDWLMHDYWQGTLPGNRTVTVDLGSAKSVDYWAVFGHDMADRAGWVRMQYTSDPTWATDINTYGANYLSNSESFDAAAWTKLQIDVEANSTYAPDGLLTADKLVTTASTPGVYQVMSSSDDDETRSFAVWLKGAVGGENVFLAIQQDGSPEAYYGSATVTLSKEWKRYGLTADCASDGHNVRALMLISEGDSIYAWGAQMETQSEIGTQLQSSIPGVSFTSTVPMMRFYAGPEVSARYWRFQFFDEAVASKIGIASFGKRVDLPVGMRVGFTPPHQGQRFSHLPQISESGLFIGRTLRRRQYETDINLQHVAGDWVRQHLQGLLSHAEEKPFFFSWDKDQPWETAYCWLRDNPSISYSTTTRMDVRLPVGVAV